MLQAVAAALEEGSIEKLVALGMPRPRAEFEVLLRPERRGAFWEAFAAAEARLAAFVEVRNLGGEAVLPSVTMCRTLIGVITGMTHTYTHAA